jgi:putative transposase
MCSPASAIFAGTWAVSPGIARKASVKILAYCLMTNHVHLIAVPGEENSLARLLQRTQSEYASALNKTAERTGHVWQNRFYSCPMDGTHLVRAVHYVELNPVRAGLAGAAWTWPWSSARAHVVEDYVDPLITDDWMEFFGCWDYREWREMLAGDERLSDWEEVRRATRTGLPLGSDQFIGEVERRVGKTLRRPRGRPKKTKVSMEDEAVQGVMFAK